MTRRHRYQGVEIQLDDLWHRDGQPRHAQQELTQRFEVGRRMAAISLEQWEAADLVEQFVDVPVGQRRDTEADVAEYFDMNAAEPNAISGPNVGSSVTPIIVSTPPTIIDWMSTPSISDYEPVVGRTTDSRRVVETGA